MHRKIWHGGVRGHEGEGEVGGGGIHTPTAYRSIIQNKSIPAAICLTWQDLGEDQAET